MMYPNTGLTDCRYMEKGAVPARRSDDLASAIIAWLRAESNLETGSTLTGTDGTDFEVVREELSSAVSRLLSIVETADSRPDDGKLCAKTLQLCLAQLPCARWDWAMVDKK